MNTDSLAAGERFVLASTRQSAQHSLALIATPPSIPQITVKQPATTTLVDGSATPVDFGGVGPTLSNSLIFTIVNSGTGTLAVQPTDITFTGTHAADFRITTSPASALPPAYLTTFTVRFTPGALGVRTAAMHIASNVIGSTNPFDINLTGTGLTEQENWRQIYFGSPANTGQGADTVDADGDGKSNLWEFVAGLNPTDPDSRFNVRIEAVPGQPGQKAIIFSPRFADRTYVVTCKASLAAPTWSPLGSFTTSDAGIERTVIDFGAGTGPKFYRVEITKP